VVEFVESLTTIVAMALNGRTARKALICPHCGMLLRPNYAVILAMTGVWFFGFTFGLLWLVMQAVMR